MDTETLVKKIIKLNTEIAELTEVRDGLKRELCAGFQTGDKITVGDTSVSFMVRRTVNPAAVEEMTAFKKLPKAVREACYDKPKLNTRKLASLNLIDLEPATNVSEVYATFR